MDEQRKCAVLFAATVLAARTLNDSGSTPWTIHVAITDAIEKANRILEKIDERWPMAGIPAWYAQRDFSVKEAP